MKKLLAMLLAVAVAFSLVSVMAIAEGENVSIVIDGQKDAAYSDFRSIDHSYWYFYSDNSNTTEAVDPERVTNHVWFTWDDDFLYMYFEATSKDPLYKLPEGQTEAPDRGVTYYEQINFYLDTNPSAEYWAPHQQQDPNNPDDDYCDHFHCNANAAGDDGEGESKYYRLMTRYTPCTNKFNNFYRSDEGMFYTYEEFLAWRCDPSSRGYDARYIDDPMSWYMKENGAAEAAGFVDYETNKYGMEIKYPRYADEEYFQFNIVNDVQGIEWEEYGPELPYTQAFCKAWWMNSGEMLEIYFEDYIEEEVPAEVKALLRQRGELPDVASMDRSYKDAVLKLNHEFVNLKEEYKPILAEQDPEFEAFLAAAMEKMNKYGFIDNLGKVNDDNVVDAKDALLALKASVNKVELTADQAARAEVTGDGKIDAKDALEMLQFAVKKRTEFSIVRTIEL